MNALTYYENISFEEKIKDNSLQLIITVYDKRTESAEIIFNKTIPLLVFIPLLILLIPILIIIFSLKLSSFVASLFRKEESEMTYQETKDYFNSKKGYLNNLSDEEKKKILIKSDFKTYLS